MKQGVQTRVEPCGADKFSPQVLCRILELGDRPEWQIAELAVELWLVQCGFAVENKGYYSPYDLSVGNFRVEVKWSPWRAWGWQFNIHRHGKLNESQVDFYVLRCGQRDGTAYNLVFRAPLRTYTIQISHEQLWGEYFDHINAACLLREASHV